MQRARIQSPNNERRPRRHVPLTRRKKFAFALVTVVASLVLLELCLHAVGVRSTLTLEDPYLGFSSTTPLFVLDRESSDASIYRTAATKRHLFNEQHFPARKRRNTYRVFCLGGSTTFGRPLDDRTSFAGWLRLFVQAADPSRRWEIVNAGGISYGSYRVAALMEELVRYEPDLFVVYSGHNEFLERRTYHSLIEDPPSATWLTHAAHRSRIFSTLHALRRTVRPSRSEVARKRYEMTGEVRPLLDSSAGLDLYQRDDVQRDQILAHYRFNVGRMIELARAAGAEVLLVAPPANVKDFSPFKSQHRIGLDPDDLGRWKSLIERADRARRRGDRSSQINALGGALVIDDRFAQTYFAMGQAQLANNATDEARISFRRAVEEDIAPLRALPTIYETLRDMADWRDVPFIDFVTWLEDECERQHGHRILGNEYFADHVHPTIDVNRALAERILDHLIGRRIVRPTASWSDELANAVARDHLARLTPQDYAISLRNQAKVLAWAGKHAEADHLLTQAAPALPDDAETLDMLGRRHLREGKVEAAIDCFQRALELDPGFAKAHNDYGAAIARAGHVHEAAEAYAKALELDPHLAVAHVNLATYLAEQRRFDEAVRHYREVLRIEPQHARALNDLGTALNALGQTDEARTCFERSISLDPGEANAVRNLASMLRHDGRIEAAIATLNNGLSHLPTNGQMWFDLGRLLIDSNRIEQAEHALRTALENVPTLASARLSLGQVLIQRGQFADALMVWREGVRLIPDDASLANALAWILATCPRRDLRDGTEALRLARRVADQTESAHPRILQTLAAAHAETGDYAQAVIVATEAQALAQRIGDDELARRIAARTEAYRMKRNP